MLLKYILQEKGRAMPPKNPGKMAPPTVILRKKRPSSAVTTTTTITPRANPSATPKSSDTAGFAPKAPLSSTPTPQRPMRQARPVRSPRSASSSTAPREAAQAKSPVAPPPAPVPGQPNRKQRDAQARRDLLAMFRIRWPQAFPTDERAIKPLAIGVHREIAAQLPGTSLWLIKQAIAMFQRSGRGAYWRAVRNGGPRYDLEGKPCGDITPEEQENAALNLDKMKQARRAARSASPETTEQAPASVVESGS